MIKQAAVAIACLTLIVWTVAAASRPRHVTVKQNGEHWQLLVDGKPFFIRGVGCNQARGEKGEDYLRMAREMGANAVRTWGGAPRSYLDKAHDERLMVNLGIWLDPVRESGSKQSYHNAAYVAGIEKQILAYVREMKDHPALLTWNLGNEALAFTEDPREKAGLGEFLEAMVRLIHLEDPHHPVVYACSAGRDLPELKKYVPSIDIIGTNAYGSISPVLGWLRANNHDKPVMVTEFGPLGSWDCPKDKNGIAYDPFDHLKSNDYMSIWRQILDAKARCLGGFAFVLGEPRNQDSLSWYNLNHGELRRDAFNVLKSAFSGKRQSNRAPKVSGIQVSHIENIQPGQRIQIAVKAADPDRDRLSYEYFVTHIAADPIMVEPPQFYPAEVEETGSGQATLRVPNDPGSYRVYALVKDGKRNASIVNRSIVVVPPPRD